jgi:hypothetical protein
MIWDGRSWLGLGNRFGAVREDPGRWFGGLGDLGPGKSVLGPGIGIWASVWGNWLWDLGIGSGPRFGGIRSGALDRGFGPWNGGSGGPGRVLAAWDGGPGIGIWALEWGVLGPGMGDLEAWGTI